MGEGAGARPPPHLSGGFPLACRLSPQPCGGVARRGRLEPLREEALLRGGGGIALPQRAGVKRAKRVRAAVGRAPPTPRGGTGAGVPSARGGGCPAGAVTQPSPGG